MVKQALAAVECPVRRTSMIYCRRKPHQIRVDLVLDPVFSHQGRNIAALASLYAFRMLGLFMVLPVLMLYADDYQHSTAFLMGLALGAYGFSQALLQIPFGIWSDRWGRKPVIALGLIVFAIGSVIAAVADTVYGLIFGRFLQGAGAIASALMAMVGDLTSEENRTKAMAAIGASIGVAFSIALIVGPLISSFGGPAAIFWLTAAFALLGLAILIWILPNPPRSAGPTTNTNLLGSVLKNPHLLRLDWGILVLHFVLMANFVVLPTLLQSVLDLEGDRHWQVYLPLLALAFLAMLPFIILAERKGRVKQVFLAAVALLGLMQFTLALGLYKLALPLLVCLFFFFMAFNLLEASLPSLISKTVPSHMRGTANGIYSTSQFAGAFLGGSLGGAVLTWGGVSGVFILCSAAAVLWLLLALPMTVPGQSESRKSP